MKSNLKILSLLNKNYFSVSLILLLAFSRLIPHPPNFTPIIALAIMSSYFFKNIYFSISVLLISMLLSDIFIGFHLNMVFVYASLFLIIIIFNKIINKITYKNLFLFSLFGSLIFFIISNFGVWLVTDLYENSLNGLLSCYILAIPFFHNTLLSTLLYLVIIKLVFDFSVKKTIKIYF